MYNGDQGYLSDRIMFYLDGADTSLAGSFSTLMALMGSIMVQEVNRSDWDVPPCGEGTQNIPWAVDEEERNGQSGC